MKLFVKQTICLDYLEDDKTKEVLYGGAAGGGKSRIGCYWVIKNSLKFKGSRWLIGRSELKNLKATTLVTFFEVCKDQGLREGIHYKYNAIDGIIKFYNGSIVLLKDLKFYPSDPSYDSLGSLEIAGAFIDEVAQIDIDAWNIVKSRCRHNLNKWDRHGEETAKMKVLEYNQEGNPIKWLNSRGEETKGLIPKILGTCNPNKGFSFEIFYRPYHKGELPDKRKFIQSFVYDNPNISPEYIETLKELDPVNKARLLEGKWEFEENEDQLISYESIENYFTNSFIEADERRKRVTIDVARKGKDKSIIRLWYGYRCVKRICIPVCKITELAEEVKKLCNKERIPMSNVVADEDGVGGGLVDILCCQGFIANSRPIQVQRAMQDGRKDKRGTNYINLKAQCTYIVADLIQNNKMYEQVDNLKLKQDIIQEMEWVRSVDKDKDTTLKYLTKDKIKEVIKRSPDDWDSIMMFGYFELVRPVIIV